jgi:hypothetical protein
MALSASKLALVGYKPTARQTMLLMNSYWTVDIAFPIVIPNGSRDSTVNIANCYRLDGSGIETWWG